MLPETTGSPADQAGDFFLRIFANDAVVEMVHASLTETDRWEERRRSLSAPVIVWLTLMLALQPFAVKAQCLFSKRSLRFWQLTIWSVR